MGIRLGALSFFVAYYTLLVAGVLGWIMNFIAVIHFGITNAPMTTELVVRIVGVVVLPLGAIMGYL